MDSQYLSISGDRVISVSPVFIDAIIINPDGSDKAGDVTLYDGVSTGDPKIGRFRSGTGMSRAIHFNPCLETIRGLYADIGSDVESFIVQFHTRRE